MLARAVIIVVAPIVLLQAVLAYLIVERHFDGVTRQMTDIVAAELRYLAEFADAARTEPEARSEMARAARTLGFSIRLKQDQTLPEAADPIFYDVIARAVEEAFRKGLQRPVFVALDRQSKRVELQTKTRHGVLHAVIPHRRVIASNPHLLLTWMAAAAFGFATIALLYLRNQIRPIQALARAADAFGKGRHIPLDVSGAQEVRMAAHAFLDARDRIDKFMEQRTRMLSGVSHDLRTPLTRMRLSTEMMDDEEEARAFRADIDEMAHIIDEFLDYARGDSGEAFEEVDFPRFVDEIAREARRAYGELSLLQQIETPDAQGLKVRRRAVKRAVHNVLENAFKHGETVRLSLSVKRSFIEVIVEDDGPGIAEKDHAQVLKPFSQLDQSRNRDKGGGVGLGLALVLDTVRGHGGDLTLNQSEALGGLAITIRLPR